MRTTVRLLLCATTLVGLMPAGITRSTVPVTFMIVLLGFLAAGGLTAVILLAIRQNKGDSRGHGGESENGNAPYDPNDRTHPDLHKKIHKSVFIWTNTGNNGGGAAGGSGGGSMGKGGGSW